MKKSRDIEVFGMSFMDLISCGLGGVIVLMLLFSTLVNGKEPNGRNESEAAALKRQQLRSICHFYLEIDVVSDDAQSQGYLDYQQQEGVFIDSMYRKQSPHWKRYVVSYSLPENRPTGVFPFKVKGRNEEQYKTRIRLFTDQVQEHTFDFTDDFEFTVKKIARNYSLKV